eukprot:9941157-Heterocapsa_arctica.AAC.1
MEPRCDTDLSPWQFQMCKFFSQQASPCSFARSILQTVCRTLAYLHAVAAAADDDEPFAGKLKPTSR